MLSTIFKKRFTDEQLSNVFVNGILEVIDQGFEEVKDLIVEDTAFIRVPDLSNATDGHFTMIVIVGNIKSLSVHFSPNQQKSLEPLIFERLADVFEMEVEEFKGYFEHYSSFMSKVNHPSKIVLYSMSKAIFYKYGLNQYQEDYFKSMDTPNPLFLKRLDAVMDHFLWNWEAFFKRYKLHS
ncbi:MAG TPA: hypothetical protein VL021_09910 [Brumimicrobium sp.]|nr:hypothetical protein [Brumimicrobium sp.]